MSAISNDDVIRCPISLRNPFAVEHLPVLSRVHSAAFRIRRRLSKRFIGKPAKRLFRLMLRMGMGGKGGFRLTLRDSAPHIAFNARNTQFGALYLPQSQPVYEPETSALLDALVPDHSVFFDVGANWGWYSLLIASRPSFTGSIHAFEPFPATFHDLDSVVREAGLDKVITCHDIALAERDGQSSMAFSDGVQSGLARLGEAGGTKVAMARLDSLGLPAPDVIKIDSARPFIVFENWLHRDNQPLTLDPFALLAARDYRFFYPGWVGQTADCIQMAANVSADGTGVLALVPFLAAQRFQLPSQLNVVAVPVERFDELKGRLASPR
jgi:FkbM family methyltransferase